MLTHNPISTTLNQLIRLNHASEQGFETAAEHVKNRGVKLYLKSYAQQRAEFAAELQTALREWGGVVQITRNPLAALHRGWIDIKAALTIGRDNEARVVLRECVRGESIARKHYRQAQQALLPVALEELIERQATQVQQVYELLCQLAECEDETLLVQLFTRADTAQTIVAQLTADGIDVSHIRTTPVAQFRPYACHCQRQRLLESSSAGAVLGLCAGAILGFGVTLVVLLGGLATPLDNPLLPLGFSLLAGALGGALFGLLIGQGITEDDAHFYQASLQQGGLIVAVQTANGKTQAVRQILQRQHYQEHQAQLAVAMG